MQCQGIILRWKNSIVFLKVTYPKKIITESFGCHYTLLAKTIMIGRVLARISKMPVQNSSFKISARPDLANNLLQILIPATINSPVCQEGQYTLTAMS